MMHRQRAAKNFAQHRVLFDETQDMLSERLGDVKRKFESVMHMSRQEEESLPFAPESFDLIRSSLSLHWVNDLPGVLAQIKAALKPEGLFMAALLGGNTLHELRGCLLEAELAVTGGVSPRVSPSISLPMAADLLQRAGFALPVADQDTITMTYSDMWCLMRDIRGMGGSNASAERSRHFTRRAVFTEAARLYQERYALPNGRISATFDVIFLHGWKG